MRLDRVTVTGADDSTDISEMIDFSERFPFVEWGILVSSKTHGTRFPSRDWLSQLCDVAPGRMKLSCHVCGKYVRDICLGHLDKNLENLWRNFQRIQLNFHGIVHEVELSYFTSLLSDFKDKQFIFQLDGVNNDLLDIALQSGINAVPLFDTSGGVGRLPEEWPKPFGSYYGYAGGLSPSNLRYELIRISEVAGDTRIWVDAETHLRSNGDFLFDMQKVMQFLFISKEYIVS